MNGKLTVCGTPIGNLEDISLRVIRTLKEADVIAAEDTRHTRKLLSFYDIHTPTTSYHAHNAKEKGNELLQKMLAGQRVALVTDAGMPAVSDPGELLVRLCRDHGVPVTCAPGPTAATTALALSGLPSAMFVFIGFLPRNKKDAAAVLENLRHEQKTMIFYEAPHHLKKTVKLLYHTFGDRPAAFIREMTKIYEECLRMNLAEAVAYYDAREPAGEFVVVLSGESAAEAEALKWQALAGVSVSEHVRQLMESEGLDKKAAMKAAAKARGVSKSEVYAALLSER